MIAIIAELAVRRVAAVSMCALSCMAAAMFLLSVELARAEQNFDWSDSTGRFALTFSGLGWVVTPSSGERSLTLLRGDTPHDNRLRICMVTLRPFGRGISGPSQQEANEQIEVATERLTARGVPTVRETVGDVTVIRLAYQSQGFDVLTRDFLLPEADGFSFVSVSCTAPAPLTADERTSMTSVLNSLQVFSSQPSAGPKALAN